MARSNKLEQVVRTLETSLRLVEEELSDLQGDVEASVYLVHARKRLEKELVNALGTMRLLCDAVGVNWVGGPNDANEG